MTDTQLIIAVTKLDGWIREESEHLTFKSRIVWWIKRIGTFERRIAQVELPPYLTSRDAIIPVIERQAQKVSVGRKICDEVLGFSTSGDSIDINYWCVQRLVCATPKQLSIALVKATGNWIE